MHTHEQYIYYIYGVLNLTRAWRRSFSFLFRSASGILPVCKYSCIAIPQVSAGLLNAGPALFRLPVFFRYAGKKEICAQLRIWVPWVRARSLKRPRASNRLNATQTFRSASGLGGLPAAGRFPEFRRSPQGDSVGRVNASVTRTPRVPLTQVAFSSGELPVFFRYAVFLRACSTNS